LNNLIYIAGPITNDGKCSRKEQWNNVYAGLDAYAILIEKGYNPILPHFSWFFKNHHVNSMTHEDWLQLDYKYIKHCDYFFYLGPSRGSVRELEWAEEMNKVIFNHDDVSNVPPYPPKFTTVRMGDA